MFLSKKNKANYRFYCISLLAVIIMLLSFGCGSQKTQHLQIIKPEPPPIIYNHFGSFNLRIAADSVEHYSTPARLRAFKRRGFNTITVDVFDNFRPIVPLETWNKFHIPKTRGVSLTPEMLETFIEVAHSEGFAVWMGINTLPLSSSIKEHSPDLYLYLQHWFMENLTGDYKPATEPFFYFCPQHPLVKEFFLSLINEFHETYSFKGTVLNGIQYPFLSHLPQHSFCLCQYCKKAALEEHGMDLSRKHNSQTSSDQARQTMFYNYSLKNFVEYLRQATSIPDSIPFIVEIHGDYQPYQNPYHQDYIYWSEALPDIEFVFKFRSLKILFEEFASIEMNVSPRTLIGLQIDPLYFREAEHPINDFFEFFFMAQPYNTLIVDVRNLHPGRIEALVNTLSERNIFYPWGDLSHTVKTILQTEYDAPYLTSISKERIAMIYTYFHQYLEAENMEERGKIRESLINNWTRTTHLVNIKNTPALKNLQVAFKYFHFVNP